ncbi:MAG TPA: hypothetical protein VGH29_08755 [Candidatus Binataceae bacterium]
MTTSQIEWHNLGHPGFNSLRYTAGSSKVRSVVIIRPGDQILYEVKPGSWCRIDELDLAMAAGHSVNDLATSCRRCARLVLERRPGAHGFWRTLVERIALKAIGRAN